MAPPQSGGGGGGGGGGHLPQMPHPGSAIVYSLALLAAFNISGYSKTNIHTYIGKEFHNVQYMPADYS